MNPYPTDPEQDEKDEQRRESTVIRKAEVIDMVEKHFLDAIRRLKIRSEKDQEIIGSLLTVTEQDLIKDLKTITEFQKP